MTLGSDLDLIFVYTPGTADCPLHAAAYFDRLAKCFVNLLNRHGCHGLLYGVDMRLRPHGGDGPLATALSGLTQYYVSDCWTWELQALTRARVAAGDPALAAEVEAIFRDSMTAGGKRRGLRREVAAMRALMEEEHPAASVWDVKRAAGGAVDIEFICQTLQLLTAAANPGFPVSANTFEALDRLACARVLRPSDLSLLAQASRLFATVQQAQRSAGVMDPADGGKAFQRLLLRRVQAGSLDDLERRLEEAQGQVRARFRRLVAPVGAGPALGAPNPASTRRRAG
jgi:glutamate-ammonia-ligase adenylyltransferase